MKIPLTETEIIYLEEQHKAEHDGRIRDRTTAVLLNDKGWTYKQIAEALLIHETTVWSYLSDYLREGKLKPNSGGSRSKLDEQQTEELIAHFKLTYEVSYTQQGMHDWLSHHRFSHKNQRAHLQNLIQHVKLHSLKSMMS